MSIPEEPPVGGGAKDAMVAAVCCFCRRRRRRRSSMGSPVRHRFSLAVGGFRRRAVRKPPKTSHAARHFGTAPRLSQNQKRKKRPPLPTATYGTNSSSMLALKKKREAEAKAKAEAEAAAAAVSDGGAGGAVQSPGSAPTSATTSSSSASSNNWSLLGVAGKKTKAGGSAVNGQKKRTPGEIRIQKGECNCCCANEILRKNSVRRASV